MPLATGYPLSTPLVLEVVYNLKPFQDFTLGTAADGLSINIEKWTAAIPIPTVAEILAGELQAHKFFAIERNRAECSRRIYVRWPAGQQASASLGVYPQATIDEIRNDIAAMVAAENAAADLINAATTVAEVEAVTVTWPVI